MKKTVVLLTLLHAAFAVKAIDLASGVQVPFSTASTKIRFNATAGTSLTMYVTTGFLPAYIRCVSNSDGSLIIEGNAGGASQLAMDVDTTMTAMCSGYLTAGGAGQPMWSLYTGVPLITFGLASVAPQTCSATVDNVDLGVLIPGSTTEIGLPITTTGGTLNLTSPEMSDGVIHMVGDGGVTIQSGENVTVSSPTEWSGITGASSIKVNTSTTASGNYTAQATATLTCD